MSEFAPSAEVICDSVSPVGDRLTTMVVKLHRFVLPELNTHRAFSRNSSSSRAIPYHKLVEKMLAVDVVPLVWASEKPGMQGGAEVEDTTRAKELWLQARHEALYCADRMRNLGVHKSIVNRMLEPFTYQTVIISSTGWQNFFDQRCGPLAQPEMRMAAIAMRTAMANSVPVALGDEDWHTPFIQPDEYETFSLSQRMRVSAARCARVSYLTHDGKRDISKDIGLYDMLMTASPKHYSPLEHVATPSTALDIPLGNFKGWRQLRHLQFTS